MNIRKKTLRVLVAYNESKPAAEGTDPDLISEAAVMTEAENIHDALIKSGHHTDYLAIKSIDEDIRAVRDFKPDLIFNLCEGYRGNAHHEMHVAGMWELLGIPYTGNTPLTLGMAQNKVLAKKLFESRKIPTPMYQVYSAPPKNTYLNYPLIAKPANEDASIGITQKSILHNFEELKQTVSGLLERYQQPILVEKFIQGREFNVSILGNGQPRVLPVSEISFTDLDEDTHHITSYEAKWLPKHPHYQKTPAICPAVITADLKRRLEDVALQVYHLLMGRDYGRVDIRVDNRGHLYILEYNPNPDISEDAGYANALRAAGIRYRDFVEYIINQALNRNSHGKN